MKRLAFAAIFAAMTGVGTVGLYVLNLARQVDDAEARAAELRYDQRGLAIRDE